MYNFFLLFTSVIVLGIPLGLTSLFPKLLLEENGLEQVYSYLKLFLSRILILTLALTLVFLIFSGDLSLLLVETPDYYYILFIILLAAPFSVGFSLIEPLLKARAKINTIVKVSIIGNVVPFLILIPLIAYLGIQGVSYYLFLYGCLPFLVYILFFDRKFIKNVFNAKAELNTERKKSILKIGIVSLVSSFLFQFSIIYLRKFSISSFGIENTGIYQSLLSLSTNYFTLIYVFLANYSLPKLSSFSNNEEVANEINNNFRLLLFIVIPIIIVVFTYREYIIEIIFSSSFKPAANYIIFQVIGDLFRAFAALFGLWLIPKEKLIVLIAIDCLMNFLLLSLPYIFLYYFNLGIESLPISYLVAFFTHCLLFFLYSRKSLLFKFTKQNIHGIIISSVLLLITFSSSYFVKFYAYFTAPIFLLSWIWIFLEEQEKKTLYNKFLSVFTKS